MRRSEATIVWIIVLLVFSTPAIASVSEQKERVSVPDEYHTTGTNKTGVEIHGSFTIKNSPPAITNLTLLRDAAYTDNSHRLKYILKIEVADRNTLRDIREIVVAIKTNRSESAEGPKEAIYRWTPDQGWELIKIGGWEIDFGGSNAPDDLNATSGIWQLSFISSNAARKYCCDIGIEVRDSQAMDRTTVTTCDGKIFEKRRAVSSSTPIYTSQNETGQVRSLGSVIMDYLLSALKGISSGYGKSHV